MLLSVKSVPSVVNPASVFPNLAPSNVPLATADVADYHDFQHRSVWQLDK
jgi:hypothetical protein